ncbi:MULTISPECIES: glutamate-1-semialdehyde 2,1-aminomutase [Dehalobacter]|jgi:glutamate-1-semialdehyde 2,1-aminomutase|uniref:Glutamate-1-semialdehyde 2,1-aminomutase n=2 Tax=Dehalobacter restrictus TaxID=55583 RepID=A0A857DP79_9FIRM|nr:MULTISPECIES: glutamate-1-semialdehyde 2,1-aminomutase [Dehalobacter]AHF11127.1 glutamate-1-semialdehyde aminotransferase [Dehalobacter restrictus DSM 9455]MCG1024613.1 glutamate-1-semialdehyde 2,1-aminomutase [Dehalobacter sp.]MDJ0305275.1 glutamate-1-semialdehyde 2,1-aminomutase [Dehalobacter sp.]OCZ53988.1 glutamate-1-semialdehyde-2,1-aminomutase [Dehalobacter sp. TeCB1]QHA01776.1 glutamate-1-semialdehyde 2,1-aminomutase [Dehalobacter restrictus]
MKSEILYEKAKQLMPGGVNSPVRNFQSVGDTPRFISHAKEARLYDVDGNEYIDYIGSWGPMILGHANPEVLKAVTAAAENGLSFGAATEAEVMMAQLIFDLVPSIEMIRMVNSGTEATMSAVRAARGFTGRNKIIKFEGCYHGHSDAMLVKAGSGVMSSGVPSSLGVPPGCAVDTLTAVFNDIDSVQALFENNKDQVAAVIVELVPANMGVVLPKPGFLQELQKLCTENSTLLIADEVITGFRLGLGGAQELFGIKPDLTAFGKIIGGGMPVGAYGGRKEIMQQVAPCGGVYQAGTLSGNPVAMAAGIAQLSILKNNPQIYTHIDSLSARLSNGLRELIKARGLKATVNSIGSLSTLLFTEREVYNYTDALTSDTKMYGRFFSAMLDQGIYLAPAQFEAVFISNSHTGVDIDRTLECAEKALRSL